MAALGHVTATDDQETAERLRREIVATGCVDLGHREGGLEDTGRVPADVVAEVVARLAASPEPRLGRVVLTGIRVDGSLVLDHRELPFSLKLEQCRLDDGVDLQWARTRSIHLTRCRLGRLGAPNARIDGDLHLEDCRTGPIDLRFAQVAGHLRVDGGEVSAGQASSALVATGLSASGSVQLTGGVHVTGAVELAGATAGRLLVLNDSHLSNPDGTALEASRIRVDGPIFARNLRAEGGISLRRAEVRGFVDLDGSEITNVADSAFFAPGLQAEGGLHLRHVRFGGGVFLLDARVGISCSFQGAVIRSGRDAAIDGSRMVVDGPLFMNDRMTVDGGIALRRAKIAEFVTLSTADVRRGSQLFAVFAPVLRVDGPMTAEGATFDGGLNLLAGHAELVDLGGLTFEPDDCELNLAELVTDDLRLPIGKRIGPIDLRRARITLLGTGSGELPPARLEGLVVADVQPVPTPAQATRWIRSVDAGYSPQPYEQFAAVYRQLGHDDDARAVLRAKQRHRRAGSAFPARAWGVVQDVLVGYGYRPERAAAWLLALLLLGTVTFSLDPPAPTGRGPAFNAAVYSWDLLVPVGDYGQQQSYSPSGTGLWIAYFLISAGWLLATACLAGITRTLTRS